MGVHDDRYMKRSLIRMFLRSSCRGLGWAGLARAAAAATPTSSSASQPRRLRGTGERPLAGRGRRCWGKDVGGRAVMAIYAEGCGGASVA